MGAAAAEVRGSVLSAYELRVHQGRVSDHVLELQETNEDDCGREGEVGLRRDDDEAREPVIRAVKIEPAAMSAHQFRGNGQSQTGPTRGCASLKGLK